jgi:hypothetical protein
MQREGTSANSWTGDDMITRTALRFVAALIAANTMSPAFGRSHRQGDDDMDVKRHAAAHHKHSMRSGHAFGIAPEMEFHLDPNSPEATGGGSPGYNERL